MRLLDNLHMSADGLQLKSVDDDSVYSMLHQDYKGVDACLQ